MNTLENKLQRSKGRQRWLVFAVLMFFLSIVAACSFQEAMDPQPEPDGPALIVFYTDN